ncbi:MAG: hypothetical protein HC906_04000 [Bacteroidales bacterium]|nr:hypothetical protein [Bacteroidales bacterium]
MFKGIANTLDTLLKGGNAKLNVVHFGGSHIQADMYTHTIRLDLENLQPGIVNNRGFIFPYRMAATNNPSNYRIEYRGNWTSCKNTDNSDTCQLGVSGVSVSTNEVTSGLKIYLNPDRLNQFYF